jgi:membrane protein YdbS with pleckstrin-like domain
MLMLNMDSLVWIAAIYFTLVWVLPISAVLAILAFFLKRRRKRLLIASGVVLVVGFVIFLAGIASCSNQYACWLPDFLEHRWF